MYLNTCINFENISILSFSIYYYYTVTIKKNISYIYEETKFWIVTAYFLNSAGTFFLYLYISSLNRDDIEKYYTLNYVFTIIRTIVLSVALLMKPPNKVDRQSIYL